MIHILYFMVSNLLTANGGNIKKWYGVQYT